MRIRELEHAIEQARETELSISMQKAKKVLKEMQTQAAAADMAASLSATLLLQPCLPAKLKVDCCKMLKSVLHLCNFRHVLPFTI